MNDHAEIQQTIVSLLTKAQSASCCPLTDNKAALKDIYAQIMAVAGIGYLECGK